MIQVPQAFAARRISVAGEPGRQWIESLPETVAQLCATWGLTVAGDPMTGEVGLVVPVVRGKDELALKVSWPDESSEHEALALTVWDGRGAVHLVAYEEKLRALLLERADHRRPLSAIPVDEAVETGGKLLRRLAVPAPTGPPTLGEVATGLATSLPNDSKRFGDLIPSRMLDAAVGFVNAQHESHHGLLVNSDLHYDNILSAQRAPWLAIDPKVVVGDVEYGLAPLLWNLYRRVPFDLLPRYFQMLIEASQADPEKARLWTIVRMVDYWLWAIETGLTEDPKMCKAILEILI